MKLSRGLHIVFGGQWGSEGKGKIVGYMAAKNDDIDAGISCFMPNAGHTHKDGDREFVFQQIPVTAMNPYAKLLLGPTSAIDVEMLMDEISRLEGNGIEILSRLHIHPNAVIIEKWHKQWEKEHLVRISSTIKGCGAALADKVRREPRVRMARDMPLFDKYIHDTTRMVNDILERGGTVIGELAQGFELSLNHSNTYPCCTSRDCTPQQFLNDIGVHWGALASSTAVVRTYPIRVGNVRDAEGKMVGYSGDVFPGQKELDWDGMSKLVGRSVEEITTVTKKVRRVFEWSWEQIDHMYRICRPTCFALTFLDYLAPELYGESPDIYRPHPFVEQLDRIAPVRSLSTGPDVNHMIMRY